MAPVSPPTGRPRRVVVCAWRDESHPEAGGSERYVGEVVRYLASRGDEVTVLCADHGRAPRDEVSAGVRWRRRGGRLTVFPRAVLQLPRLRPDIVVDVQNGVPFLARFATRAPVVVLVHHVHREQWRLALGPLAARIGWWVESRVAPRALRGCQYVTVSLSTLGELVDLGVDPATVRLARNGCEPPGAGAPPAASPTVSVVGRLVPHKRVEHALLAVHRLRAEGMDVRLDVVGEGHWRPALEAMVARLGLAGRVRLHGWVDQATKQRIVARSWVHLCPSVKEGWGLAVVEAASHGVPSIAFRAAGGVTESVLDGVTGLLVDDPDQLVDGLRDLLTDTARRQAMSQAARQYAAGFRWADTGAAVEAVLSSALAVRHERLRDRLRRRGAVLHQRPASAYRDAGTDNRSDEQGDHLPHRAPLHGETAGVRADAATVTAPPVPAPRFSVDARDPAVPPPRPR